MKKKMSKCNIPPQLWNVKIGFRATKSIFDPIMKNQNRIPSDKIDIPPRNSNVKIDFRRSNCDIRAQFECQNRISNVKMRCSTLGKWHNRKYECQSVIFFLNWSVKNRIVNVKNTIFAPNLNVKIKFRMSKWDIRPQFECQNRILNGKMLCSVQIQSNEK